MEVKSRNDDVEQSGFRYGSWKDEAGRRATAVMLQSESETSVVWCANDAMALGALAAAKEAGRRPGRDILIGGVDLSARALGEVAKGALAVSVGGHLIDGARALVRLHDHHQSRTPQPVCSMTHLVAVGPRDARRYLDFCRVARI